MKLYNRTINIIIKLSGLIIGYIIGKIIFLLGV